MEERHRLYSSLSPQYNLYNPGYDPTGDVQPNHQQLSYLPAQPAPGQQLHRTAQPAPGQQLHPPAQPTPGQYAPLNTYPVLQQPTLTTHANVPNVSTTPVVKFVPRRDLTWDAVWCSVCCFWNIGLCALYYAIRAENNYVTGNFAKSEVYRRRSVLLIRVAAFLGSFVVIAVIIAVVLLATLRWSAN